MFFSENRQVLYSSWKRVITFSSCFLFFVFTFSLNRGGGDHEVLEIESEVSSPFNMMDCNNGLSSLNLVHTPFTECGLPGRVTFTADVANSVSDLEVEIQVPNSFDYKDNLEGASELSSDPLVVEPIVDNNLLSFSFDLQALCGADDDSTIVMTLNYIVFEGTPDEEAISCEFTSLPLLVSDVFVSIAPEGTPGRNTENKLISVLDELDTLINTIIQTGDGVGDTVFYYVADHPLLELQKVYLCETGEELSLITSSGGFNYYGVGSNGFLIDGTPGFVRNEGVDVCEVWITRLCPDGDIPQTLTGVVSSCTFDPSMDICQEDQNRAALDFDIRKPQIEHSIDASIPFDPICAATGPYKQGFILYNTGNAPAKRIVSYLTEFAGGTPIDITSVTYKIGQNGSELPVVDNGTSTNITSASKTGMQSCVNTTYANSDDLYTRFRADIDDLRLDPGDTLFLAYMVYPTPCGCNDCNVPRRHGVDIADIDVYNLCDEQSQLDEITLNVAWPNFDVDFGSFMESPVTNCFGETSTLSTTVSNYGNSYLNNQGFNSQDDGERNQVYFNDEGVCSECYLELVYELPFGLDWVGDESDFVWADDDGTVWNPQFFDYTDNNSGADVLTVRFIGAPPAGWDGFIESSLITMNYTPDCDNELARGASCSPVLYDAEISKTVRWSQSGDCPTCIETVECVETLPVVIKCPGIENICVCDGFVQTQGEGERFNLYDPDPDNDRRPEYGQAYDESLIRRDRFLKGDSIEVKMGGTLQLNSGSISNLDYIYAEIEMPNSEFIPIGGEVTIIDATDNQVYTCDVLTQTLQTGDVLLTDLSISQLVGNGCTVPPTYEDGDSIALVFYYMATGEFTGEVNLLQYRTRVFASEAPYGQGSRRSCRLPLDYRLTQVGTQRSFGYYTSYQFDPFEGCETGTPYYRGYSRIGSANVDYFPGEYIGFVEYVPQFKASIPPGMQFNYFRFYVRQKNASSANSLGSSTSPFSSNGYILEASHPSINIVGDMILFDVETFLIEQFGSPNLPFSDEGYSFSFQPYYVASCDLEPGDVDPFELESEHLTNEKIFCSVGYTDSGTRSNITYEGGAEIIIEAVDMVVRVDQFPTCARIRVRNTSASVANNTWLSIENQSGDIIFQSLTDITGGGSIPVSGSDLNMFQLGDIEGNEIKLFELCAVVNSCESDNLEVFAGYDCLAYPDIRENAVCQDQSSIEFVPVTPELSLKAKVPFDNIVLPTLCDTVEHVVDLNASGPGFINDLYLDIRLPSNVEFVPGSFEIAYPTTATPTTVPPEEEWEPASDPTRLNGKVWRFDVSGADTILEQQGLVGTAGSAFNLNVVNIRYKVVTGCGYSSGSRIVYRSTGREGCGSKLRPKKRDRSKRMRIFGAPDPFLSTVSFDVDTLDACSNETTPVFIEYQINGDMGTSSEDSIRVVLPAGISYVPNSYRIGTNPLPDPPVIESDDGEQILYWGIQGLDPGQSAFFSFDIQAEDIGQECEDYPIIVETFKSGQAYCPTIMDNCLVRSLSDQATEDIFINKPELMIENASVSAMSLGDEEMIMLDLTIVNEGTVTTSAGSDIIVDIYSDLNNDGRLTEGVDQLLCDISFNVSLTPGESVDVSGSCNIPAGASCSLLAVLDVNKNCSCSTTKSSRISSDLDLKIEDEYTACSNEEIEIGPEEVDAYQYSWISLGGSDLSALSSTEGSPVNFEFDNNTGAAIVWDYGLLVERAPGCYILDTITITIQPETEAGIETDVCGPIMNCGEDNSNMGFELSGPTDGSQYLWSIVSGDTDAVIDDPSIPNAMVSSGITETTLFLLNYLDANGCPALFEQKVNTLNCACTALGDTVWYDLNVDGLQDPGEPGIPGMTVYLYNSSNLSTPIQTTRTDDNGYYAFLPLPQGEYVVRFDTLDNRAPYHILIPTAQDAGDDERDSDANPSTGFTGPYFVPNGISNWTIDAGFYPAFDLALLKEVDTVASPSPYFPGDQITYTITVINQGGYYVGQNIEIVDYLDANLSYVSGTSGSVTTALNNSADITNNGDGSFVIDELQPLDTVKIQLVLEIDAAFSGEQIDNYAEISDFTNDFDLDDVDSTPDNISDNDSGGNPESTSDNTTDGDGSGNPGETNPETDEDDHDPARVNIAELDLALLKLYDNDFNPEPVEVGELVKFDIVVINQGNIAVSAVDLIDYPPSALIFDENEPLNQAEGWDANGVTTINRVIYPGERDTVSIYFTTELSFNDADYINAAEIKEVYDINGRPVGSFDIDSEPDSNTPEEQATAPDSNGDNNIVSIGNTDVGSQDDHDIADVFVIYPNLSVEKNTVGWVNTGGNCFEVTFEILVSNSGLADGIYDLTDEPRFDDDVSILDARYTTNAIGNSGGSLPVSGSPTHILAQNQGITGGRVDRYEIIYNICMDLEDGDGDDVYSACLSNDGVAPNAGEANFNRALLDSDNDGSVDATDSTCLDIPYLILNKSFTSSSVVSEKVFEVIYTINVENIGGDIGEYSLIDLPQFDDDVRILSAVVSNDAGIASPTLNSVVPAGGWTLAEDVSINPSSVHTYTLVVTAELDINDGIGDEMYIACGLGSGGSPTPGEGFFNTAGLDTDGDGDSDLEDEACGDISNPDLALKKELDTSRTVQPAQRGSDVFFEIWVYNQSQFPAYSIEVVDYHPSGLILNDADWVQASEGVAQYVGSELEEPLAAGDSIRISVQFTIDSSFEGDSLVNYAEIASFDDDLDPMNTPPQDADSRPDANPNNDAGGLPGSEADNYIDGDGSGTIGDGVNTTDEDDHDPAVVQLCKSNNCFGVRIKKRTDN